MHYISCVDSSPTKAIGHQQPALLHPSVHFTLSILASDDDYDNGNDNNNDDCDDDGDDDDDDGGEMVMVLMVVVNPGTSAPTTPSSVGTHRYICMYQYYINPLPASTNPIIIIVVITTTKNSSSSYSLQKFMFICSSYPQNQFL